MLDPVLFQAVGQRLDQLRRREQAPDVVPGRQDGHRLIDHVGLVRLQVVHPALPDELYDPSRVEVDAEADAAAVLRQMLHRETQPARAAGPQHQPVGPLGEALIGQRLGEKLVVGPEVVDGDAALRYAGGAAGLEHVDRTVLVRPRHPAPDRAAPQPLVLEVSELSQDRRIRRRRRADPSPRAPPSPARTSSRLPGRSATRPPRAPRRRARPAPRRPWSSRRMPAWSSTGDLTPTGWPAGPCATQPRGPNRGLPGLRVGVTIGKRCAPVSVALAHGRNSAARAAAHGRDRAVATAVRCGRHAVAVAPAPCRPACRTREEREA